MADLCGFQAALSGALQALSLDLDAQAVHKLERFAGQFLDASERMNLTSITAPAEVAVKHFADSLSVLHTGIPQSARLIDVGTGGGFPGVAIAIARPDLEVVLLDATGKKVRFLNEACAALGLARCEAVTGRAEEVAHLPAFRESFEMALWRGLGRLKESAELCLPFVRAGGRGIAMKGPKLDAELSEARAMIGQLGGVVSCVLDVDLPGGIHHRLLAINKMKATPARFPRPWGKIRRC